MAIFMPPWTVGAYITPLIVRLGSRADTAILAMSSHPMASDTQYQDGRRPDAGSTGLICFVWFLRIVKEVNFIDYIVDRRTGNAKDTDYADCFSLLSPIQMKVKGFHYVCQELANLEKP
jgi:hypothetical protein